MNITTWIGNTQMPQNETGTQRNTKVQGKQDDLTFGALLRDIEKKCPYSYMAKDGIIEYNGVVFVCDYKNNSITLGDMTDPKKVLNISLPSGGNLKVNVENFGDISKAASMFSPEDLNAILRAIHQYNYCTSKLNEMEEKEEEGVAGCKNLIERRILNHEADQKFMTGGKEYSLKEWDKLIENFDEAEEEIQEELKERLETRKEQEEDKEEEKRKMKRDRQLEMAQKTYLGILA